MLIRAPVAGLVALIVAGCVSGPRSVLPPVRDGTLSGAAATLQGSAPGPAEAAAAAPRPEFATRSSDSVPSNRTGAAADASPRRRPTSTTPLPVPGPRPAIAAAAPTEEPEPGNVLTFRDHEAGPRAASSAVAALLDSARTAEESRNYGRAASALERALKVEPRNPELWYRLATVRYRQGRHAEVEALARRSLSLAPGDARLVSRNWRVIAAARGGRGDEEGAREALRRANAS